MRIEKNVIRYFGFDEVAREVYGLKPATKQTQNAGKRKDMQQKFEKNHMCKTCGQPMTYIGGNLVCCKNPECKKGAYIILDDKNKRYAQSVFGEGGVN